MLLFVNVRPDLAKQIPEHLPERNPFSMFLNAVNENEILDIVKNYIKKNLLISITLT